MDAIIISSILLVAIIVAIIILIIQQRQLKKQQVNNFQAEKRNLELRDEEDRLLEIICRLNGDIESIQQKREEAEEKLHNIYQNKTSELQKEFDERNVYLIQKYDEEKLLLQDEYNKYFKEIESLKATKAAMIEANKKEQDIAANPQLFLIPFQEDELHDIEYLNNIRPKMRFPQVIGKVIWTSFIQKKMSNFICNILGTNDIVCGIYKITNQITQECYIGQSLDIKKRWLEHIKSGVGAVDVSVSNLLYAAMRQYGIENFTFELLEKCDKEELNKKEKFYIELYQSDTLGYNITKGNGNGRSNH